MCTYTNSFISLFFFRRSHRTAMLGSLCSFTRTREHSIMDIRLSLSETVRWYWCVCVCTLNAQATLLFHCTVCLAFSHRHIQCHFIRMRLFYEKTQRTHWHFVCALAHSIHAFRDCTGEQETAVCVFVYAFVDNNRSLNHVTFRFRRTEREKKHNKLYTTQHDTNNHDTALCRRQRCWCCRCCRHVIVLF